MKRKATGYNKGPPAKKKRVEDKPYRKRAAVSKGSVMELKSWDLGSGGIGGISVSQVNTTGSITNIFAPVQGTDSINRIGRKVLIKSVNVRGVLYFENALNLASAVSSPAQWATWCLIWDKQPNGGSVTLADIFTVNNAPLSNLNLNNRERFIMLKRKFFTFDPFVATATDLFFSKTQQFFKSYTKLNMESTFNSGNLGTIADINTGALYSVWIGSGVAGTNTDLNASYCTRVRFVDA